MSNFVAFKKRGRMNAILKEETQEGYGVDIYIMHLQNLMHVRPFDAKIFRELINYKEIDNKIRINNDLLDKLSQQFSKDRRTLINSVYNLKAKGWLLHLEKGLYQLSKTYFPSEIGDSDVIKLTIEIKQLPDSEAMFA